MRASNIALVILGSLAASFIGGFTGAVMRSRELSLVLPLPGMLLAAHLIGGWVARRETAPNRKELVAGTTLYAAFGVLVGLAGRHPETAAYGLVGAGGASWILCRAALRAQAALQGVARKPV